MTIRFTILSAPRTKKNSSVIPRFGRFRILPSKAHQQWFKAAMKQLPIVHAAARADLFRQGCSQSLPLTGDIHVCAQFYRESLTGDLLGYEEALADWLQAPVIRKGKQVRDGAGIIQDDKQIVSWDGSRMHKDAACPRIECEVTTVGPGERPLFEEAECATA